MKKVIIAMLVIASTITSCKKQAINVPAIESGTTDKLLEPGVSHYYHGQTVTHQSEISSYHTENLAIVYTSAINGEPGYYYFDNEEEEMDFLVKYPVLKPLYNKLSQAIELREYAKTSGAIDHFELTGIINTDYQEYADKYKTRAYYTLFTGLNGAGAGYYIPGGGSPTLPGFMNDNAESYDGDFNVGGVFKRTFFRTPSLIFLDVSSTPVNFPPDFRNLIRSAN